MPRFVVDQPAALGAFLGDKLPGWKRSTLKRYLERGAVQVNGQAARRANLALAAGDVVELEEHRPSPLKGRRVQGMTLLYLDEQLIVVDKPPGLLSTSEPPDEDKPSVLSLLARELGSAGERDAVFAVHRLDRDTSGVMVVARSKRAREELMRRWGEVEKVYAAVVEGEPLPASGTIDAPLVEDLRSLDVRVDEAHPRARRAVTHYTTVTTGKRRALLDVRLETGHKHQIRVHLASRGHPIAGDPRYGTSSSRSGKQPRMALHARRLSFPHPLRDERLTFESAVPPSFDEILRG